MMDFNLNKEKELHGIVIFEMKEDGCLNGLWTNNQEKGEVYNEIAKKFSGDKNCFTGLYSDSWIQEDEIVNGKLRVSEENGIYTLEWIYEENKPHYKGSGFKFGNLLVATYWQV